MSLTYGYRVANFQCPIILCYLGLGLLFRVFIKLIMVQFLMSRIVEEPSDISSPPSRADSGRTGVASKSAKV